MAQRVRNKKRTMNAPAPTVSAVITSFNRADTLVEAVESVLAQTRPPLEILVLDNISDFDVCEVMRPYEGRVRAWRNPANLGVSGSRNAGAAAARGDYVAFLDDDDRWMPEKLERQMAEIGDALMSVCGKLRMPGERVDILPIDFIRPEDLKRGNVFCGGSGFLCKRSLFEQVQFDPKLKVGEDWDFLIQASKIQPIRYQREALFYYRTPLQAPSLTNEIKQLRPEEMQVRYDAADKNRDFLGPRLYRRRIADSTLAFIGSRRDPLRFIAYSMRRAGVAPTLAVLAERAAGAMARRLRA
jgi:glycosyltransferase involved in cell wall biosynthesis